MTPLPAESLPGTRQARACLVKLAGSRFAVEVRYARQVVVLDELTVVPLAPPHLLGDVNLRGSHMPLVDNRPFLGLEAARASRGARALVVDCAGAQAGESLKAIADVSQRSAELAQDISQATQQQVRGAESVAQAMQSIQAVAAQTERGVLEARRTVDELARLAEELTASLARFKLAA
ncbi:MAG: chemotaxis protein CheW [Candidatus Rokubacteria bacterium]|nr:chemotaxis protein CheW [Candidatus Rokubacteria bacterium]